HVVLLVTRSGSASPSNAQACTSLPALWRTLPSGRNGPSGRTPVSSSNSRRAAASGSSPGSTSPFGMVHAPASLFAQNGPPGCARNTSSPPPRRRNSKSPALTFDRPFIVAPPWRDSAPGLTLAADPGLRPGPTGGAIPGPRSGVRAERELLPGGRTDRAPAGRGAGHAARSLRLVRVDLLRAVLHRDRHPA